MVRHLSMPLIDTLSPLVVEAAEKSQSYTRRLRGRKECAALMPGTPLLGTFRKAQIDVSKFYQCSHSLTGWDLGELELSARYRHHFETRNCAKTKNKPLAKHHLLMLLLPLWMPTTTFFSRMLGSLQMEIRSLTFFSLLTMTCTLPFRARSASSRFSCTLV